MKKLVQAFIPKRAGSNFPRLVDDNFAIKDPHTLFSYWFCEALQKPSKYHPDIAVLATVNSAGQPVSRLLNIEQFDANGFRFYTDYVSSKANEIANNPNVALTFYWPHASRSVRIEGRGARTSREVSLERFRSYSNSTQLSICQGNECIGSKRKMSRLMKTLPTKFYSLVWFFNAVPMPESWGGIQVQPKMFEFTELCKNKSSTRVRYWLTNEKIDESIMCYGDNGWVYERMLPGTVVNSF